MDTKQPLTIEVPSDDGGKERFEGGKRKRSEDIEAERAGKMPKNRRGPDTVTCLRGSFVLRAYVVYKIKISYIKDPCNQISYIKDPCNRILKIVVIKMSNVALSAR